MSEHSHKCGHHSMFPRVGIDPHPDVQGCGHVWAHPLPPPGASDEEYKQRHICPACGAGPWYNKWFGTSAWRADRRELIEISAQPPDDPQRLWDEIEAMLGMIQYMQQRGRR
jgi:hypothetical protein